MINIGNSSIENILVGDTQVDRVYLGTDIVWEYQQPSIKDYLKFTALESGTFTLTIPAAVTATSLASISYSLDSGATWITTQNDSSDVTIVTPTINAGRNVLWKGSGSQTAIGQNSGQYSTFSSTGNFKCSGNIMSLLHGDDFEDKTTLTKTYCFCRLFYSCSTIITAPQLPATTITQNCYREMFGECTQLEKASKLPATLLQERCYVGMFYACKALTNIPEDMLPATTTKQYCYYQMFHSCSSITHAPTLPALTLATSCYQQMFIGCNSLIYITCLATNISATNCTNNWVNGVDSHGTFVKNASMQSWATGRSGIPSGWTIVDYNS